jgi:hypothetical protein
MMTRDADKRVHLAGDRDMWLEVWQDRIVEAAVGWLMGWVRLLGGLT